MTRTSTLFSVVLLLSTLPVSLGLAADGKTASPKKGADKPAGVYWFVYDASKPAEQLKLCTKAQLTKPGDCPRWEPDDQFLESSSLIRLRVLNGKFRSVYNVAVNGIVLTDNVPAIRGVDSAAQAQQPPSGAQPPTPSPTPVPAKSESDQFSDLKNLYVQTDQVLKSALKLLSSFEGTPEQPPNAQCVVRAVDPSAPTVLGILAFAQAVDKDSKACLSNAPPAGDREKLFDNLIDRTDHLISSVSSINALLISITPALTSASTAWQAYQQAAKTFGTNFPAPAAGESQYLEGGALYKALSDEAANLQQGQTQSGLNLASINVEMASSFGNVNSYYDTYSSERPFDLPIGQYNSSYAASFQINEVPGFARYAFASPSGSTSDPAKPVPSPIGAGMPAPTGIGKPGAVGPGGNNPGTPPAAAQPTPPPSKTIYAGNFDVHKFYRANLVAGFFASTLRNREYGVVSNGQSSPTLTATIGVRRQPQLHYYVGLDYYAFGRRDLFPGAMTAKDYLRPSILVGYGADATNNFLLGLNWETKWGLTLGTGFHIGQESFLAAGIQPNVTPLPSGTSTAPTTNRTRGGGFVAVGFDLSVFKAAFGQLLGGGVGGGGGPTPASTPGGGTGKGKQGSN